MRRLLIAMFLLVSPAASSFGQTEASPTPVQTIQGLCDALIAAMKQGSAAGFVGRKHTLEPVVRGALDLPFMTRIVLGPPWRTLTPDQQGQLVEVFGAFSVANYANQFSGYSGESFSVDPTPTHLENGDLIVHTQLSTKDPTPIRLDYLMRLRDGRWKVIDVFLSGTISQLAARRSEYSSVLRAGGAQALIDLLKKKTAELSG
jgi:phospholipid transport system substrate-binding protein